MNVDMRESEKLFYFLGYKCSWNSKDIYYTKYIVDGVTKTVRFNFEKKKVFVRFTHNESFGLSPELVKAINLQLQELEWLGDDNNEK